MAETNHDIAMQNLKTYTVYGGLALGLSVGVGLGVRKIVRDIRAAKSGKDGLETGSAANAAIRIRMAFENNNYPGTDEETIYAVLREMPNKRFYAQIYTEYKKMYTGETWSNFYHGLSNDLTKDMKSELSTSEFAKAQAIINSKPQ